MKRAVIALALLLAIPARGEIAVIFEHPYQFEFWIVNDNIGAVYDSYTLETGDLINQIWNANPRLHDIYSNMVAIAQSGVSISVCPDNAGGEVNVGWTTEFQGNGDTLITNIGGRENRDYDVWYSTSDNSDQDLMIVQMSVDDSLLDLDGDGWSAGEDLVIENDTNQVVLLGVGYVDSLNQYYDYAPRPVVCVGGERGKVAGLALDGLAATNLVAGAEVSVEEWGDGVLGDWVTNSTFTATGKVQQVAVPMTNDSGWFRLRMRY